MFTRTRVVVHPLSVAKWSESGGGFQQEFSNEALEELNDALFTIAEKDGVVKDIKVNHFTIHRHNNGGADEVWVQYTIIYEV